MFWKYCFAHALQGTCKAVVIDFKSEDDEGKIIVCVAKVRKSLANCFTWTKKRSLGPRALKKAQNHVVLKLRKIFTPIKNDGHILLVLYNVLLKIVQSLITFMVQ